MENTYTLYSLYTYNYLTYKQMRSEKQPFPFEFIFKQESQFTNKQKYKGYVKIAAALQCLYLKSDNAAITGE